ncbi:Inosine/uridine-preferring nucleoside hydrolase domain-containing protein [Truncatella angustata]|uniref:Inosine/uridine-preferring nucleoside hydrolase domain-containing protein n=1 Tax=Truncatella angustata TaxID=152316 RepID=A0A9P8UWD2_9PEZI|nr:Inosine/uridine-preferring nucleoside hydrolase domain-containing protein [Truncatella angustata]KAH6659226.1 Inosine/uridine-preferring nucleoside hydrolase domain-containing protein [Truncatella angustata]
MRPSSLLALTNGAVALCSNTTAGDRAGAVNAGGPKIIMDNDWNAAAATQFLMALDYGWDILGLVGDTSNSWAKQCSYHALALLEIGNLSCIPVHKGSDYPLLVTPKLMQTWQTLLGPLPWQGVFAPENATLEALGSDPTSGDPQRIVKEAFIEGYPNTTLAGEQAAAWMVEQVRKYPGEVVIYEGGSLTNIALAVRLDPDFAKNTAGLWIMGGFVDVNLLQTSASTLQADINTDFNFKADPEAAKIALTADFPNITLVSSAANGLDLFPTTEYIDEIAEVVNPYTILNKAAAYPDLPFWDEATLLTLLDPSSVLNQTSFYVNVDTSYYSPTYGNIYAYQEALLPTQQDLRSVNYVYSINGTTFRTALKRALQYPKSCT